MYRKSDSLLARLPFHVRRLSAAAPRMPFRQPAAEHQFLARASCELAQANGRHFIENLNANEDPRCQQGLCPVGLWRIARQQVLRPALISTGQLTQCKV